MNDVEWKLSNIFSICLTLSSIFVPNKSVTDAYEGTDGVLQIEPSVILGALMMFLHRKQSDFDNIKWFLSHTLTFMKKDKNYCFQKTLYNWHFSGYDVQRFMQQFRSQYPCCLQISELYLFFCSRNKPSKSVMAGLMQADSTLISHFDQKFLGGQ